VRRRLSVINNNGRVSHWRVAVDAWRAEPLHGTGAGTFQNRWNQDRKAPIQVLDAHSLYVETLGELGVVGLALLLVALGALVVGLVWRLRGPERPTIAAVLALVCTWAVHAGADWDWELTAVSVWVFGLAGIALAGPARTGARLPRIVRLIAALGCLVLALPAAAMWRSQTRLEDAVRAFDRGDCPATIDAALDSVGAVGTRAEPWELIAYCDVRLGQGKLAIGSAEAAVRRDPEDWEYHYALALVRGSQREDPRAEAARALALNPLQPEAKDAVQAFGTRRPAVWERRARRLPLYLR
jgi:HAMP domain-containing protein